MLKENQRPVWEGIFKFPSREGESVRLLAGQCKSCRSVFFPTREICPNCFTENTITDYELSTRGKIYSFTVCRYPGHLVEMQVPYAFGFVDLPQDNIRIYSLIDDCENLKINMDVELTVEKLYTDRDDGKEVIGYKFRPLEKTT
jgi:uncharacterized OB-fold protein